MIRDAAAVVSVDGRMVAHALERIGAADRPPCRVIPNGYDEDDFRDAAPAPLPVLDRSHGPASPVAASDLGSAVGRRVGQAELGRQLHFWQIGFVDPRAMRRPERAAPRESRCIRCAGCPSGRPMDTCSAPTCCWSRSSSR